MFVRVHRQKQGGKVYSSVQLCESYRDPAQGGAPRNRVIVNLGPVDKLGVETLRKLARGFQRAAGDLSAEGEKPCLVSSRDYGHVHAVGSVWDRLGLSEALVHGGIGGSVSFPASELIRMLVVNRVCDPCSKLALLDWLDSVHYDDGDKPPYHHLLRAMDRLLRVKEKAEPLIARRVIDAPEPLDLVFYDITSTYFEGERSLVEDDFRRYGYSRDGRFDKRPVVIGMVVTREGIPLCHHVFPGNTADRTTVSDVVKDLRSRFALSRVVFVGDRGMLSDANLNALLDEQLGFIVAHPLRRNQWAVDILGSLEQGFDRQSDQEQFLEEKREGVRFVLAYSPVIALESKKNRERRLAASEDWIKKTLHHLTRPEGRGRRPTPEGTYDRIRDHLRDRNLLRFYRSTRVGDKVTVVKNGKALEWEEKIDGMLMLETTDLALSSEEVVQRYKELAEIERGWRSLKSTLLIRPVYHWTEARIRAHIFVCVLALQVERWMRSKLKTVSVPKLLSQLQRIKIGELETGATKTRVVTRPTDEHKHWLALIGAPPIPSSLP